MESMAPIRKRGIVRSWNDKKGSGVIAAALGENYYLCWNQIKSAPEGLKNPVGYEAEFSVAPALRPDGFLRACQVIIRWPEPAPKKLSTGAAALGGDQ